MKPAIMAATAAFVLLPVTAPALAQPAGSAAAPAGNAAPGHATAAVAPAAKPATVAVPPPPVQIVADGNPPSLHVRCDGNPPRMSDAESFARLVGAVTLLGLFAPPPEAPAPDKRLFGAAGVDACGQLLDGPKRETVGLRRLPLIVALAVHQIEAKNYAGAIAGVGRGREEAKALNLAGNPYFDRSMGLSFNRIEAAARLRAGDAAGAREAGLADAARMPYSNIALFVANDYAWANRSGSATEDAWRAALDRVRPILALSHATRLDELGRFAEAAALRDGIWTLETSLSPDDQPSWPVAASADSLALAGAWDKAQEHADRARKLLDDHDTAGKPEADRAGVVEMLDLYEVLRLAHDGHIDDARRNFAARSQWTEVSFGATLAVTRMLRAGARPEQLFGALAKDDDALWQDRQQRYLAAALQKDTDNKTLFQNLLPYANIDAFERASHAIWDANHSSIMPDKPFKTTNFWLLDARAFPPVTQQDALMLRAAIEAKARGRKGFVFISIPQTISFAWVEFGNPGDRDMLAPFFLDADTVIAELRQIIPSPDELKAREAARAK